MSWIWSRSARRIAWVLFFAFIWTCIGEMPASAAVKACKELRDAAMPKCVALSDKEMAQIVGGCSSLPATTGPCQSCLCGIPILSELNTQNGSVTNTLAPTAPQGKVGGCSSGSCVNAGNDEGPGSIHTGLYYNSSNASWQHIGKTRLMMSVGNEIFQVSLSTADGSLYYFTADNANWFTSSTATFTPYFGSSPIPVESELYKEDGVYKVKAGDSATLRAQGDIVHVLGQTTSIYRWLSEIRLEFDPGSAGDDLYTTLERDADYNLTQLVDQAGNRATFVYIQGTSRIDHLEYPGDVRTTFQYDAVTNDLTAVISPTDEGQPGTTITYGYDSGHRMTYKVIGGARTTYTYDDAGRLSKLTDALGNVTTYLYTPSTGAIQTATVIRPDGGMTTYVNYYLSNKQGRYYEIDPAGYRTTYDWDSSGRMSKRVHKIDGQLCTKTYAYDAVTGNISTITYSPANTSVVYTYYSDGKLKTITNEMGQTTTFTYDYGRLKSIEDPVGGLATYVYDSNNSGPIRVEATGENGVTSIAFTYISDGMGVGRRNTVTDGLGNITTLSYDTYGNLQTVTESPWDGVTYTTTLAYDLQGRSKVITAPDSTEVNLTYDCCGIKTVTDQNGNVTTINYWADLSQMSVEDPENQVTETSKGYTFATSESWQTVKNPENKTTTYIFDTRGLLKKIHYADGTSERYTYEESGKPKTKIDQIGRTTTFSYDTRGWLTKIDYPNLQDMLYYHDNTGRRTGMVDRGGNTSYVYCADGSLKSKRFAQAGTGYEMRVTYSYYPDGNRQEMAVNGSTTVYHYDAAGRLKWFTNSDGLETTYYYDGMGRKVKRSLDNGAYTSYYYNNRSWVTDIQNVKRDGSTVLSSFSYYYSDNGVTDNVGNIMKIVQKLSDGQVYTSTYTYDDVYRITGERRDGPSAYGYTYTYDGMGNRLTMPIEGDGVTTYAYDLDSNNELDTEWSGGTTNTYTYDGNGNTIRKVVSGGGGTTTFTYSDDNKMTRITYPDSTSSLYASDGDGRRVRHRLPNGDLECYFYDGDQLVLVKDANGNDIARYTYGPDGLVYMRRVGTGTDYYYGCDHLGSVWNVVTADVNETIAATYTYTAFGNVTASDTVGNPFRYVGALGYYHDYADSGLMLLGHRYYNSSVGRFTVQDPIKDGKNWYWYANNCPIVYVDPDGESILPMWPYICGLWGLHDGIKYGSPTRNYKGNDQFVHCVATCRVRRCGTKAQSWFFGHYKEQFWDRIWGHGPDPRDYEANHAGEESAKEPGSCPDNCRKRYPDPRPKCPR